MPQAHTKTLMWLVVKPSLISATHKGGALDIPVSVPGSDSKQSGCKKEGIIHAILQVQHGKAIYDLKIDNRESKSLGAKQASLQGSAELPRMSGESSRHTPHCTTVGGNPEIHSS